MRQGPGERGAADGEGEEDEVVEYRHSRALGPWAVGHSAAVTAIEWRVTPAGAIISELSASSGCVT